MVSQQDLVEVVTSPQILKVLPLFGGEIVDTCQTGYLGEHIHCDQNDSGDQIESQILKLYHHCG